MKKKLLDFLLSISKELEKLHFKLSEKDSVELDYSSLSPIDNGDEKGHYSKALEWAIENRKEEDIKNIALTGPYGSGKSTILKTFQKKYKGKELKFLNISLATFKEEKIKLGEKSTSIKKDKDELLRLIETSILQQIFYHEEDKNIPDSRFKKIKSYSAKKLLIMSVGVILFMIAIMNYFYPNIIQNIFKDYSLSSFTNRTLHYGSVFIILIGVFFIVYKSIRTISSITINKLKFQNAEIGIGESINKSILNHHLDEILYFFSIRPYNVVIIEDLDRFQETDIFTKLREINLLLNNSKKTKKKNIVFIYAVRDDMFSDNERIKFFDFIIPVIPVINSSNSSEIILFKKKKYNYNLTDAFIEDISFFIDDMRLLHNITNEFYLYKVKKEETPLVQDKLFALITYKNIYPNDFVALSKNEGELYKVLNSKSTYLNKEIKKIDEERLIIKKEISQLHSVKIVDIGELRLLYVIRVIEELDSFHKFIINNEIVTINELIENENFEYLKSDKLDYQKRIYDSYYRRYDLSNLSVNTSFEEVEELVDSEKNYEEREKEIIDFNSDKISLLKLRNQDLEKKKSKLRNLKISSLLQLNSKNDLNIDENFNKDFITLLVRNGYISEDYLDYISLFHEGSITRNDHKFIVSIRNKQKLDFNYKLTKIDKVISKINPIDFSSEFTLNYNLLDFVLMNNSKSNENILGLIFSKLKDESTESINFINEFIEITENLNLFIKKLCNFWANIWGYYVNDITYLDERLNKLLKYILEYADISSIVKIEEQSNLKKYLLNESNPLNIITEEEKLKSIIEKLQLKFINLNFENSSEDLLNFIYINNYYKFDKNIVSQFVKKYGEFEQVSFDNSNYSSLKNSKTDDLINYINENIDDYVENLYLKIETNINEAQKPYIELLNNTKLSLRLKKEIIKKVSTKISEVSLIKNHDLISLFIQMGKIEPKWINLLFHYNRNEEIISEVIIDFINKNAEELSKTKIPTKINGENIYGVFVKKLIQKNEIESIAFNFILKSVPWWYSDLDIANLNEDKVIYLIKNQIISPTNKSFESLKENFSELNIILLENHTSEFIEIIDELDLDGNDLVLILKSKMIDNQEKNKFLSSISNDRILSYPENLKLIVQLILNNEIFEINDSLLENLILHKSVSSVNRIKIFNKNLINTDEALIERFLEKLGGNYGKITVKNKKAKIEDNVYNKELLNNLKNKNYISSFSKGLMGLRVNHRRI